MLPVLSANGSSGYTLSRSVRLRSSASAYLNRTFGTPTSQNIWTYSVWVKRGALTTYQNFGPSPTGANNQIYFDVANPDKITWIANGSVVFVTTQVFRDPSAWYHIVLAFNGGAGSNKVRLYINGSEVTSFSTDNRATTTTSSINTAVAHSIGNYLNSSANYFDGYLTEINFVDGQQLTPSSFGSTNATTGVWRPAKYTGTYGTNGFYLNFSDNSAATAAAIGKDYSGNGNNWTPSNISVTAGVTYDSMTDVPTLTSATAANYAVYNPINLGSGGTWTISNANLSGSNSGSGSYSIIQSTIAASSGSKWYFEFTATNVGGGGNLDIGVMQGGYALGGSAPATGAIGQFANGYEYCSNGVTYNNNTTGTTYSSYAANDVIMIALDLVNNKVYFGKNGTWQNSGNPVAGTGFIYSVTAGDYFAAIGRTSVGSQTGAADANFGQRPFTYTPPTGFKALNTYNLPASTITNGGKYMAATTYTGTGASQSVTNAGSFKPDLVWVKSRSAATDHKLTDSVRGTTKALISDTTGAETTDTNGLTAFGSAGFTVGSDTTYNNNTATYVGWQWQAGQGSTSSNTSGSITSTVSVNATAGFSVATFNAGAAGNKTVGHGLGVKPAMFIWKDRTAVGSWHVWHQSYATQSQGYMTLNGTAAVANDTRIWANTAPTSTVLSFESGYTFTANDNAVAYCWSEVPGFSKFGSYTGNGNADGPFVYCGFRPRWVLIKRTDAIADWVILDTARDSYNMAINYLVPNTSGAETAGSSVQLDSLANGFKVRGTWQGMNTSGGTYIFTAFAENPFANALAR